MFDLTGKTALVTGATGGIGEAIARALHQGGANLILSGRREEKLQALQKELGARAEYLVMDLADNDVTDFVSKAGTLFDGAGVDILVNNAGITRDNLFMRMKQEEWDEVLRINLTSIFVLTQSFIRAMLKKRYGRIINIGSVVGIMGNPGQANYCAAKAGLVGFSKSLAREVANRNITVNVIAPGFIETEMTAKLNDAQREAITGSIPMGSIGKPDAIAAAALYLAGESGAYITGQTLHINGGMVMV